jgi:hypothetical protein
MTTGNFRSVIFFYLFVLLISGCGNNQANEANTLRVDDTLVISADTPNIAAYIPPLFSFFERNKNQMSFDTNIYFLHDDWGHLKDFVIGGHIFSQTQTHALIVYNVMAGQTSPDAHILAYKKDGTTWSKVLDDTILRSIDHYIHFKYRDWNCDGIKDLGYVENGWEGGGHGPITWNIWLVDKDGQLSKVHGFEELNDPNVDSITGHVFTNDISSHIALYLDEYKFSGNRIIKLPTRYIEDYATNEHYYHKNDKLIKKTKGKANKPIYRPKYEYDF